MKRFLLFIIIGLFIVTGCESKNEKIMKCSHTINQSDIKFELSYNVTYSGEYVVKVKNLEKIISDDISALNTYKEQLEKETKTLKGVKYYEQKISINENILTSSVNIDYSKINMDKLIKFDPSMKELVKDGKILVKDIESLYNKLGITCNK